MFKDGNPHCAPPNEHCGSTTTLQAVAVKCLFVAIFDSWLQLEAVLSTGVFCI